MVFGFITDWLASEAGGLTQRKQIRIDVAISKMDKLVGRESFIGEYENRGNR